MKSKSVEREFLNSFLKDNLNDFSFCSLKSEPFSNNIENNILIDTNYILQFFKNKKIYIEIYNEGQNDNKSFNNLLIKYGIKPKQKLSKDLDYIIFKDGLIKTQKFAIENEVKLVNPLWLHDKLIGNFKEDEKYLIKKKFSELNIDEKIYNLTKNKNKSCSIKRKKTFSNLNNKNNLESIIENEKNNFKDKKLNSFFSESNNLVNTLSYKINKQEYIEFLQTKDSENKFKYNGNIENENDESKNEFLKNTKVIFVNKEYDKYDYKIVEFIYKNIFLINLNIFTSQIILNDMQENIFKIKDFEEFQINKNIKNYNNKKSNNNKYSFYIDNLLNNNEFILIEKIIKNHLNGNLLKIIKNKKENKINCKTTNKEQIYSFKNEGSMLNIKKRKKPKSKIRKNEFPNIFFKKNDNNSNDNIDNIEDNYYYQLNDKKISKKNIINLYKISKNIKNNNNNQIEDKEYKQYLNKLKFIDVLSVNYIYDCFYKGEIITINESNLFNYKL